MKEARGWTAEKVAPGVWREGPPRDGHAADAPDGGDGGHDGQARGPEDPETLRLRTRRDEARWFMVAGFGSIFLGAFWVGLALGGAAMVVYGAAASVYWGRRLRRHEGDPWDPDPEIDAWEQEMLKGR